MVWGEYCTRNSHSHTHTHISHSTYAHTHTRALSLVMRGTKVSNHLHCRPTTVVDGSHNVSRWMTWLPISLKNAAKCDKWYQLQNLSITESLNANGAWKKTPVVQLQACHVLSVEQKPIKYNQILCLVCAVRTRRCSGSFCARLCERDNGANRSWQLCLIRHSHCRSLLHVSGIRAPRASSSGPTPLVCVCVLCIYYIRRAPHSRGSKKQVESSNNSLVSLSLESKSRNKRECSKSHTSLSTGSLT